MKYYLGLGIIFVIVGTVIIILRKLIVEAQEPTKKYSYSKEERNRMLLIGGTLSIISGFIFILKSL